MNSAKKRWISEEKDQTFFRMGISTVTFCAILGTHLIKDDTLTPAIIQGLSVILLHSIFSICWYFYISKSPEGWSPRIYVTMFMDITTTSLSFYFAARFGSFFSPVFLWVIVGYGLRFGKKPLFFASMMAFLEFALVLQLNEYWQQNRMNGVGLWWGLVILPAFFMIVLQRVSSLNNRLQVELVRSKAAEKAKGEFLASMIHEIRTPLNGVLDIINLAGNAIKFTNSGYVKLAVQTTDLQNGTNQISVEIQDSGVGIPKDRLPYIFDQFEQAETSTTRNFGGTGLGLAISRHLGKPVILSEAVAVMEEFSSVSSPAS